MLDSDFFSNIVFDEEINVSKLKTLSRKVEFAALKKKNQAPAESTTDKTTYAAESRRLGLRHRGKACETGPCCSVPHCQSSGGRAVRLAELKTVFFERAAVLPCSAQGRPLTQQQKKVYFR